MNIKIALALFIVFYLAAPSEAFGGRSGGGSGGRGYSGNSGARSRGGSYPYNMPGIGNEYGSKSNPKEPNQPKSSGRNISTLQIVFVLTLIMTLGFAGYYFIQFYPFLCSKESKYDVMDRRASTTPTPTHSREFEYDESTSSATKSTNASYSNEHDV